MTALNSRRDTLSEHSNSRSDISSIRSSFCMLAVAGRPSCEGVRKPEVSLSSKIPWFFRWDLFREILPVREVQPRASLGFHPLGKELEEGNASGSR